MTAGDSDEDEDDPGGGKPPALCPVPLVAVAPELAGWVEPVSGKPVPPVDVAPSDVDGTEAVVEATDAIEEVMVFVGAREYSLS